MLEVSAVFAVEEISPKPLEEDRVRSEDLAELGPVVLVYQPDQAGWGKGVSDRAVAQSMVDFLNHLGQAGCSQ